MTRGEIGDSALQTYRWFLAGVVAWALFDQRSSAFFGLVLGVAFVADIIVKILIEMIEQGNWDARELGLFR